MKLQLDVRDQQVWRHLGGSSSRLPDTAQALLEQWASRYAQAVAYNQHDSLFPLGREMFGWLDQGGALRPWLQEGVRELEVIGGGNDPLTDALLAAPWEILADDGGFLALDQMKHFLPLRRIASSDTAPRSPGHGDLAILFMAGAPEGQHELDYEAEEAAILEATRHHGNGQPLVHLTVEESGELTVFADRHRSDGPFDILHLSCHGDIRDHNGASQPILLLETDTGAVDPVPPESLVSALGETIPPLLFLSACRSGQRGTSSGPLSVGADRRDATPAVVQPSLTIPFAQSMASHVPHVLGWDGSVYDADAKVFAQALYAELARGSTVAYAAADARRRVFAAKAPEIPGEHWHLARVYLGAGGGGPLCNPTSHRRRAPPSASPRFLDAKQQVRVASRTDFVGRRRQLQRLCRVFAGEANGAIIHGLGNLGKSSLAARLADRLADRMPQHTLAVVFGHYDGLSILAELERVTNSLVGKVFPGFKAQQGFRADFKAMREAVQQDVSTLESVFAFLFEQIFTHHPLLLVIDDFEQALEPLRCEQTQVWPRAELRPTLAAVLTAFRDHRGQSRLLITSRYDFALPDGAGGDLAGWLIRVPLVGMTAREQRKQWLATAWAVDAQTIPSALITDALETAAGNPGLQEVLSKPLRNGETEAAQAAIAAIRAYRRDGTPLADQNEAMAFFTRMGFDAYRAALTDSERLTFAAACLFPEPVPVPRAAVAAAASALGVTDPKPALDRLLALGLLDDYGLLAGWDGMQKVLHLAANPLARPLTDALADDMLALAADAALPELAQAWRDEEGDFPRDERGVSACQMALQAASPDPAILETAALAAVMFLFHRQQLAPQALELAIPAFDRLAAVGHTPSPPLFGHTIRAAHQAGQADLQDTLLQQALSLPQHDAHHRAQLLGLQADRLVIQGNLDEALRIRREEEIPVYQAIGDPRELAISMSKIADILQIRGDLDEALRIRREEQIPVFQALDDRRELAISMGKIADVLQLHGELDEALRIRREEEIPVYQALGDRRSLAVTMGQIADVLQTHGELDEALRIRHEEQIPVYQALGDRRSLAVTMGQIADILQARGDLDEALRIRHEEQIPVYQALGDRRSLALTMGQIADVLQARGDLDEALRIRHEEEIPVYQALGDRRSLAVTMGQIADVLQARGDLDGALDMHLSRVPDAQARADRDSLSHIRFCCARLRLQRGDQQRGEMAIIRAELAEAWEGALYLQRPDFISAIGALWGQVLAFTGHPNDGITVLQTALRAAEKIGDSSQADDCRALIATITEQNR
ncbi:CHAT domain-containing protein [Insolitispirillum peregrinum]|uniref:Tetratricopeptide repeat-containing protein n=1 Tax=Insolitispirillum peregrinum TaxID=80876 RepID=A0A1N7QBY9_9PROT|nr:CHAT domain-containing protein [Insolitispirillum peregrinum]SIT20375.1 Tetratricopeptide repeat-containing protein [Insolitispirillum peregrinum]